MNSSDSILLIDDEPNLRILYSKVLSLEGFQLDTAENGNEGLDKLKQKEYSLVITDVKLPDIDGIEITKKIKSDFSDTEVIVITAYGNIQDGVTAIKSGAFDYITKGDTDEDEFILKVKKALEKAGLKNQIKSLRKQVDSKFGFSKITGKSKSILDAIELAKKVAPADDTTVLLLGETGTGKELFAQAIHNASNRRDKSFVAINCSAIPKDLQESELFGYIKGAFTGANKDKKGFFEEANGGTIFLDEIGDMTNDTQSKLLRVLETKSFSKVGDTKTKALDIRIISATNKDLQYEIERVNFRNDLYYRLNGFTIKLPSLRERTDDIELLANEFVKSYSAKLQKNISKISDEFINKLKTYRWEGNVRELKNVIERAIILANSETLDTELLPQEFFDNSSQKVISENLTLEQLEKEYILKVLKKHNDNKTQTAKALGIGTVTLYRKLKEYGLE